jgi:hypothetical protein
MRLLRLVAGAAGAVVLLTSCSQTSRTSTPQASPAHTIHAAVLVNCPKLYDSWKAGSAKEIIAAVNAVASASLVNEIQVQVAALKKAEPAVGTAGNYPIPACADPKGYWTALLLHVNAAAASVNKSAGTASITVALKSVPLLERELNAEVKRTASA